MPEINKSVDAIPRGIQFLRVVLTVVALVGVAHSLHAQSSVGPKPTGSYSVGRTFFQCVDSNRVDPVAAKDGVKREFMVMAWYPAKPNSSQARARWMPESWASDEAALLYEQRRYSPNPLTMEQAQHAIRDPVSNSIDGAPISSRKRPWPLLLFSPGAGVNPAFYSTFTEDLASLGYVVFAVVPTGWVATVFPDGHRVPTSNKRSDDLDWITGTALPLWAEDLHFMIDQAEHLDRVSNNIFFRKLDLSKVGVLGHSFGGAASILAGLRDSRIDAVLNLDGSPFGVLDKSLLPKPLMVIKHNISPKFARLPPDESGKAIQARVEEELSSVYLKGRPGYRVEIAEAKHMTFCDMAVLRIWAEAGGRFGTDDAQDGEKTVAVIRSYVYGFFEKFLLGRRSPLLDRPTGKYGISVLSSTASVTLKSPQPISDSDPHPDANRVH